MAGSSKSFPSAGDRLLVLHSSPSAGDRLLVVHSSPSAGDRLLVLPFSSSKSSPRASDPAEDYIM